jgi:hypothetical protein
MEDELINAIAAVIASKCEHTIFIDEVGEDFERPSFFIYRISDLDTVMNRWTYNTNSIIQIVYFSPLDEHNNVASTADQTNTIKTIKHAFMASMGVKFGDKFAHLDKTNTDYTGDKDIFLQLTFNITNGTRKEYEEAQNTQTMNEFNFKVKE